MNENFRQGVAALKAGDRATARRLLGTVVRETPDNTQAWLWLSGAVERDEERIYCLRQVLQLDPGNQIAARGLAQIQDRWTRTQATHSPAVPQEKTPTPRDPSTAALAQEQPVPGAMQPSSSNEQSAPDSDSDPAQMEAESAASRQTAHWSSHPNLRFMVQASSDSSGRPVFKVRPSVAQALMGFWTMFFIVWAMNAILQESTQLELSLSFMTCSILGVFTIYLMVVLSLTRYELTTRQLSISLRGKHTTIPLQHILDVTYQQNWLQKILKTGDILVEASVAGVLQQVRLHNLTDYKNRAEQIQYLLQEQA